MRLVTYNIQFGTGRDLRVDPDRIADTVRGADVIALQEVDRFWERSGDVDQVAALVARLPGYHHVYGAAVDLHREPAEAGAQARRRQFGNLLLSRTPIRYARHHLLPKYASLGPISIQRSALEGVIDAGGHPLRIVTVHLTHLSSETRLPQIEVLKRIHRQARAEGPPIGGRLADTYWDEPELPQEVPEATVLCGDFNFEPDSPEYAAMTGPVSAYGGRMTNPAGFADARVAAGHGEYEGASAEIHGRPCLLDYFFVSAALIPKVRSCEIDRDADGSDHQPLWLELAWP